MSRVLPVALCTAASFLTAAAAAPQDQITITLVPTKGRVSTYSMTGTVDIQGKTRSVEANRIETILDVAADGSYTSKWEEHGVVVDGNTLADQLEETTVSKPSGEMISTPTPELGRMAALDRFYYPTGPVNLGDTWSFSGKSDDKLGVVEFKADLKLIGSETVAGTETWKIKEDIKETSGTTPATVLQTFWIDKKDGSVVRRECTFTDYQLSSNIPIPVDGTMTYVRKSVA